MAKHRPSSVAIVNSITPDGKSVVRCLLSVVRLRLLRCPLTVVRCLSSTSAHRALRSAASSATAERAVGAFCATWRGGCCRGFATATVVRNGIAVGGRVVAIG